MITPSACRTWTEHSERCWLSSVAAVLGIGRERREVLGRWRSNEYIRTAQRVVSQVQRTIVQGVLRDTEWQLQEIGIKDLELYLRQAGESDSLIYNQLCAFDLSLAGWCCPVRHTAAHAEPDLPKSMENACMVAEVEAVAESSAEDIAPARPNFALKGSRLLGAPTKIPSGTFFVSKKTGACVGFIVGIPVAPSRHRVQYRLKVLIVLRASSMMQLANIAGPVGRSRVLSQTQMTQVLRQTARMAA